MQQIETDYKPWGALGALYQGWNAADAQTANELEQVKQFLANQRETTMLPLDTRIKQMEADRADVMRSPEMLSAYGRGYRGQNDTQDVAGQRAMAGLPGDLDTATTTNLFANMRKRALDPSLSPEERASAKQQAMEMARFQVDTDPAALTKLAQAQAAGLKPSNVVGLMNYAAATGQSPADALAIMEGLQGQRGNIGFGFGQQQQVPESQTIRVPPNTPKQEADVAEKEFIRSQQLQKNPETRQQGIELYQQLLQKYPYTPEQPQDITQQVHTKYSEKTPKPSNDSPQQFTSQDGIVYQPKNADEKAIFQGLASDYVTPGQIAIGRNNALMTSAKELSVSLKNISILTDQGTKYETTGAWSGLKNDTLFGATASNVLKPLTSRETLQTEALVKPIARMVSTLQYGGAGGTQADRDRIEAAIIQQFGTGDRVVALQKLGELRQTVTAAMEAQSANQTLSRQQREKLLQSYRAVTEAIPFKAEDVLLWQKSGMKEPFRNYIDKRLAVQKYME